MLVTRLRMYVFFIVLNDLCTVTLYTKFVLIKISASLAPVVFSEGCLNIPRIILLHLLGETTSFVSEDPRGTSSLCQSQSGNQSGTRKTKNEKTSQRLDALDEFEFVP